VLTSTPVDEDALLTSSSSLKVISVAPQLKKVVRAGGDIFRTIFPGKISGENFRKIVSPRNSEANSAEKNVDFNSFF
jgi:hypothetical protein